MGGRGAASGIKRPQAIDEKLLEKELNGAGILLTSKDNNKNNLRINE